MAAAGLTLPPKVVGKVSGHLVMKVDEVLWARKPPGEVSAVVMWWGGEEPSTFRPTDVSEDAVKRKNAGIIYEVRTSLALFEKYLQKCGSLEIAMADKYGMPIGCASVTNLLQMINSSPYQGYYPIVNNFGNRIGDLHVSFNLRMLASVDNDTTVTKLFNKQGLKTKELKRLSPLKSKQTSLSSKSKEEKTKKNEKVLKDALQKVIPDSSNQNCDSVNNDPQEYFVNVSSQESVESRVSTTSNKISQILEHGTRLRDAMTASVMEDGIHLDLKTIPSFNLLSERLLSCTESFPPSVEGGRLKVSQILNNPCEKRNPAVEKRVLDYLSGKPMSNYEQEEALAALQNMTPTKEILDNLVPDTNQESNPKESLPEHNSAKESVKSVTNVTDYRKDNLPVKDDTYLFEVDSQLLSQINCLRITVKSLVLNSVGIKRVGSYPKKKGALSHSNIALHPPGVTYFVEYKFPLVTGSRPWESDVRYCSKRFNDHEVTFGDRTVHNLPETWRSSLSGETNLSSLISALTFKICARHLHQRVPVSLGTAAPESVRELIESVHLRHNFDLPVIATDCLPVAQLRICLELGRDRIHFGGLFDPENSSLGIRSPRNTSSASKKSQLSLSTTTKKKPGRSVTTVTRNVSSKLSSPTYKLKNLGTPLRATQADRVIKRLAADASDIFKSAHSSTSSSAISSTRSKLKPSNTNVNIRDQVSSFVSGGNSSFPKPYINASGNEPFLKHELAVTLLQVIGADYLKTSTADDAGFYITYKFPIFNALKNDLVDWCSYSTEPSDTPDGTWQRTQNRIHSIVLPQSKSFHSFLQHAFKFMGAHSKICVPFTLNMRSYGTEVQDLLIAEAHLPLTSMLTLEDAYNVASRNNSNFSDTTCSSVVLELPFEYFSSFICEQASKNSNRLRLKLDYRHSFTEQLLQRENLPSSRGDSITENLPGYNFGKKGLKLNLLPEGEVDMSQSLESPLTFPNWACPPENRLPPSSSIQGKNNLKGNKNRYFYHTANFNQTYNPVARDRHASWEPVEEQTHWSQVPSKILQDSAYRLSSSYRPEDTKSIVDVIHITNGMSQCELQSSQDFMHGGSQNFSSQGLQDSLSRVTSQNVTISTDKVQKGADAAMSTSKYMNQRHTSTRGTSPMPLSEWGREEAVIQCKSMSTSTERVPNQQDRAQQATIENSSRGSQTTPRESTEIPTRDVGTSADITELQSENKTEIPARIEPPAGVFPKCSIDDVETIDLTSEHEFEMLLPTTETFNNENVKGVAPKESIAEEGVNSEVASDFKVSMFNAKVGVECALHLQTKAPISDPRDQSAESFVFVSINPCTVDGQISAYMGLNPVSITPVVINNGEPEWFWQTELQLPVDLLVSPVKRLIFKIWQSEIALPDESLLDNVSASLIGFSAVDLTVLSMGLPLLSGWYNVMDFSGMCRGQIKLSVEPLENISDIVNLSSLPFAGVSRIDFSSSKFVAHCAYSDFPSHVTQFSDMRVQKLDPQDPSQATSAILSGYQLVLQRCQRLNREPLQKSRNTNQAHRNKSDIPLQRVDECPALAIPPRDTRQTIATETVSAPTLPQQNTNICGSEIPVEVDKDPSILLREKLSELELITKTIKARLLTRVESVHISGPSKAPNGGSSSEGVQACIQTAHEHIGEGNEIHKSVTNTRAKVPCSACECHTNAVACRDDKEETSMKRKPTGEHKCQLGLESTCKKQSSAPITGNKQQKASQKQRKTWERQEDLIDFGALSIEDNNEESSRPEDLSDWLTESALQQVFNPFLFNDILNNMNSSRGVQVIELDNTENSNDHHHSRANASHETSGNPLLVEGGDLSSKSCKRRSRRGDETYRKETPHFPSNQCAPQHHSKSGPSACDADSGVDVDLSANFYPGAFFEAASVHHEPYFTHHRGNTGGWTASSEREESSSCSLSSSRHHQSTIPSSASASATPSDSPQHTHQAPKGCQNEPCRRPANFGNRHLPPSSSHRKN